MADDQLKSSSKKSTGPNTSKLEQDMEQLYISRKSSGGQRALFGDLVPKLIGAANKQGNFNVNMLTETKKYDFLNLTASKRVNALQTHFDYVESLLKT
jgi:RAB protein geranylgeranyltransferase component A